MMRYPDFKFVSRCSPPVSSGAGFVKAAATVLGGMAAAALAIYICFGFVS